MTRTLQKFSSRFILAAIAVVAISVAGCGSGTVVVPSTYSSFNSGGGTFACEYPEGWEAKGTTKSGGGGLEWAKFISGPAEIRIDAGAAGSLMGDIAKNTGGFEGEVVGPEFEPVHAVHVAAQESNTGDFTDYKEVAGPDVIDTRLGPTRRSEFTASSSFGSGIHGYRATLLGRDKAVYVLCFCPEANWAELKPVYDHVLSTLKRGQTQ